ncbi:MAG: tetratricopeptide repeat protein, partial [Gemmataceae bacterium]
RPDDAKAQLLLADVLSWGGSYKEAAEIYRKLRQANPDDEQLALRLARVLLWEKDYDAALKRFQMLLDKDFRDPELWRGFVDAAASADKVDPRYKPTALKIYERVSANVPNDPVFLARLAWVLRRVGETQKSIDLLETALAINPNSQQTILQLAEALYDAGRVAEAKEYFEEILKRTKKPRP